MAVLSLAPSLRAEDWRYPEGRIRLFGARYSLFLRVTYFRPSSSATRDLFGKEVRSQSFFFGLLPFKVLLYRPRSESSGIELDVDLSRRQLQEAGEKAGFLAPTAGVKWRGDPRRFLIASGALRAGAYFVRTGDEGIETRPGLNAALGMEISRTAILSLRYDWVRQPARTDLSGWTLDVAFKVL
jgi:hypothetical protein